MNEASGVTGDGPRRAEWRTWGVVFSAWTLVAVLFSIQNYLILQRAGQPRPWPQVLVTELTSWWVWALMTVPIVRVVRRFPLVASRQLRVVAVHVLAGLVAALITSSLEGLTRHFLPWYEARSSVIGEVRT